jgi:hypothetical protein
MKTCADSEVDAVEGAEVDADDEEAVLCNNQAS